MQSYLTMLLTLLLLSGCGTPPGDGNWGSWGGVGGEERHMCDINPLRHGCPYGER